MISGLTPGLGRGRLRQEAAWGWISTPGGAGFLWVCRQNPKMDSGNGFWALTDRFGYNGSTTWSPIASVTCSGA